MKKLLLQINFFPVVTTLLSQHSNSILVGAEIQSTNCRFIKIESGFTVTNQSTLTLSVSYASGDPSMFQKLPKVQTEFLSRPFSDYEIQNTQPHVGQLSIGCKKFLSDNDWINVYLQPEYNIVLVGTYISYLHQHKNLGESNNESWFGPTTYIVERTNFVRQVPAEIKLKGNCDLGLEIKVRKMLFDFSAGLMIEPAGYLGRKNTAIVSGYMPRFFQYNCRIMLGFEI